METIPKSDCEIIGFIKKTHGVHGEIVIDFDPVYEESLLEVNRLFIELDGLLVPFFLNEDGLRFKSSKTAIINIEDVNSENFARRLVGCQVFLLEKEIINVEDNFSFSQLIGFLLFDNIQGEIGIINNVEDFSGNIVLTVNYQKNEILVPYNEEILCELDIDNKTIKLDLPNGLIEL